MSAPVLPLCVSVAPRGPYVVAIRSHPNRLPRVIPCRFCGSGACTAAEVRSPGGSAHWQVFCLNKRCNAAGPWRTTSEAARRAWNTTDEQKNARAFDRDMARSSFP